MTLSDLSLKVIFFIFISFCFDIMRITLLLAFFLCFIQVSAQEVSLKQTLDKIYDQPDSGVFFFRKS